MCMVDSKHYESVKKSTEEMIKAWTIAGMTRMNEFEGSNVRYITITSDKVPAGFTHKDYDLYADSDVVRTIA